jgi:hypothetical protein
LELGKNILKVILQLWSTQNPVIFLLNWHEDCINCIQKEHLPIKQITARGEATATQPQQSKKSKNLASSFS